MSGDMGDTFLAMDEHRKALRAEALREKMLARALQKALELMSNRCRQVLYEEHGEILRWLQTYK